MCWLCAFCGLRGGFWHDLLDLPRDALHVRRDASPVVDRRQQIRRGRMRARRDEVPFRQERAGLHHRPRAVRRKQHPGEARMQRDALNLFADPGQLCVLHGAEPFEQRHRRIDRVLAGPLEPFETSRIAAPRDHIEHDRRQVDPMHLRLAVRPETIARVPQATHDAGRFPSRAAGPLIGRVLSDPLELEAVDRAVGVVARDFVLAGVNDGGHAGHRHRRLGDVGGDNDPAPPGP